LKNDAMKKASLLTLVFSRTVALASFPMALVAALLAFTNQAAAQFFTPGNLLISESTYSAPQNLLTPNVTVLPGGGGATAVSDGTFATVWNNEGPDPSFGITAPITIDQITTNGTFVNSLSINTSLITNSFSSKSELGLSLSTNGQYVTFMGYVAPPNTLDVSNSNTPNHFDSTNPVSGNYQREVGQIDANGNLIVTPVNAYSGNNGRNAILATNVNGSGQDYYYMVGNAGNGSGTESTTLVDNTGVQMTTPGGSADTTPVGVQQGTVGASNGYQYGYTVTENGLTADKSGKDNNLRGETIFDNTLYVDKGSGGNGIDTVYQVGTTGTLPTASNASSETISVLPGFPTASAKTAISPSNTAFNPFGLFFANANTLYVADKGDAVVADLTNGNDPNSGLEKWSLVNGTWHLDYTLQAGLNLGTNFTVGNLTGLQNDGLRNITGQVNANGTVTLYAVTAVTGNLFDVGADPDALVAITDNVSATTLSEASSESFATLDSASEGQVIRGVSFTPTVVPEPSVYAVLFGAGALGLALARRRGNSPEATEPVANL
jgi:hypothetical protein